MKNVALLIPAFLNGRGGAEKVAGKVAGLLSQNGFSASIICNPKRSDCDSYELDPNVKVIELSRKEEYAWYELRGQFDLLIGFAMSGLYAGIMEKAAVLDCPYAIQECSNPQRIVSMMAANQQDGITNVRHAFWMRQAVLARASAVRLTVPDYIETIVKPIRPFTYGFYNSLERPSQKLDSLEFRPKKIVAVGALKTANKNGISGARAFLKSGLAAEGWSLHFYGRNFFPDEFAALAKKEGGDAILDHGISNDPDEMYADANILLIPSFEEGLPNVVVEAFSYAMPAIGYADCPGTNHLILNGERGVLVDDFSEDKMAQELQNICRDTDQRVRMADNAKQFADNNFENKKFESNWIELVSNAIAGKNNQGEQSPTAIHTWPDEQSKRALDQLTILHRTISNI